VSRLVLVEDLGDDLPPAVLRSATCGVGVRRAVGGALHVEEYDSRRGDVVEGLGEVLSLADQKAVHLVVVIGGHGLDVLVSASPARPNRAAALTTCGDVDRRARSRDDLGPAGSYP
jgi:hypothetical protein